MEVIIDITERLHSDINKYCDLNNLDVATFISQMVKKGFMVEKFGKTPFADFNVPNTEEKPITQETQTDNIPETKEEPEEKPKPKRGRKKKEVITEEQKKQENKIEEIIEEPKKRRRLR